MTEQQHLDEVMDSFNFSKVALAMKALNWCWASAELQVPTESHIRTTVRGYARQAIRQALDSSGHAPQKGFVGTGGFHVEAEAEGGHLSTLYVRFTLEEYNTFEDAPEPHQ